MDRMNDGQVEKNLSEKSDSVDVNVIDGDEALLVVGRERSHYFSDDYNRALRNKLDRVIPPLCAAVYFTQFLDKTSLNYASIMGLPIKGQHYNLVSMAFYLGYIFWVGPTTAISQKTKVAKYLGVNIVLWGIVLALHAVTTSFGTFFLLRFLLGMFESCVAPILILIITMFYKKDEQAKRISWFYVMNGLTHVFGGLTAYGISFYDGNALSPYKIVYILLGGLAVAVGVCVLIWLPDSPVHAHFLTEEEKIAALERVRDDQGGVESKILKKDQIWEALLDIRTWLVVITTLTTSIPNGGLSNFSNMIIRNFGYTSRQTLLLQAPAGVISALTVIFCGWYSDRKNERMVPIVFALVPTIVGAAILIGLNGSRNKGAQLFGIYLTGTFGSALSTIYAYNASNTSGHTKKSTINASTLAAFSLGNIIGTEIFLPKDAPGYVPGKIAIMILLTVQLAICFLLRWINQRLNQQKRRQIEAAIERHGWSRADLQKEKERHAFLDLTDKQNMFFVYTS